MAPTWVPDGYVLKAVEKDFTPAREVYLATYVNGEEVLSICVQTYMQGDPEKIEVNDDLLEKYESVGIEYYIFSNVNQLQVMWSVGSYECYIAGDLTIEEIKLMIDSIRKG